MVAFGGGFLDPRRFGNFGCLTPRQAAKPRRKIKLQPAEHARPWGSSRGRNGAVQQPNGKTPVAPAVAASEPQKQP